MSKPIIKGRIVKVGGGYGLYVPKALIDTGLFHERELVQFELESLEKEKNNAFQQYLTAELPSLPSIEGLNDSLNNFRYGGVF